MEVDNYFICVIVNQDIRLDHIPSIEWQQRSNKVTSLKENSKYIFIFLRQKNVKKKEYGGAKGRWKACSAISPPKMMVRIWLSFFVAFFHECEGVIGGFYDRLF
jgi:hypothetical protein